MTKIKTKGSELHQAVDAVLGQIIDDWYERVCPHYVTSFDPGREEDVELKFFHDEKGHRIKFNKEEHDFVFTYGLRAYTEDARCIIEISVNNKVDGFNYEDFQNRLFAHYETVGSKEVPTPYALRSYCYHEVFRLNPDWSRAFRVESHAGKADIMRLLFRVEEQFTREMTTHPVSAKKLIEDYCVSPFRSLYAAVYRRTAR